MSSHSNYLGAKKCCAKNLAKTVIGPQGPQGAGGPIGPYGQQGPTGTQGLRGATGACCRGPPGFTGAQGPAGPAGGGGGVTGAQGSTGEMGLQGATGSTGSQGATGSTGAIGSQGATGSTGTQGATGSQGSTGEMGLQGATGSTGSQGAAGINGISSGLVLYLDGPNTTQTVPFIATTDNLLVLPNTGIQTLITTSNIRTTQINIVNYITQPNSLLTTVIVAGLWQTILFAQKLSGGNQQNIVYYTKIIECDSGGGTIQPIAEGTASSGTVITNTQAAYQYNLYVPNYTLQSLSSRIKVEIWAFSTSNNPHSFKIEMRDSTLSYVITTIASNLIGLTGAQGYQGETGAQGHQGDTGAQGHQGDTGAQGHQGSTGARSSGYYGSFGSTANQAIVAAGDTAYFSSMYVDGAGNDQVNISGVNNDTFVITTRGTYNIQFSAQFFGGNNKNIFIWLEQNGVSVPFSNTQLHTIGGTSYQVGSWNWFITTINLNETFRVVWTADDNSINIISNPTPTYGPGIPSIILTVQQVR
jgi:hypothetical protein